MDILVPSKCPLACFMANKSKFKKVLLKENKWLIKSRTIDVCKPKKKVKDNGELSKLVHCHNRRLKSALTTLTAYTDEKKENKTTTDFTSKFEQLQKE